MRAMHRKPGRPAGRSGLPEPIPGEPFSLIGTLRRTRSVLTVKDAAALLVCPVQTIYKAIEEGTIPVVDTGLNMIRIDAKGWADLLEHNNPHLAPRARQRPQRAAWGL